MKHLLLLLTGMFISLGCESETPAPQTNHTQTEPEPRQEPLPQQSEPTPQAPEGTNPAQPPGENRIQVPPQYLWSGATPEWLTPERIDEGWISLFDGETLFGWRRNSQTEWVVEEGSLTASSGEQGLLLTPVPFADFEFRCDFRVESGGNSGVFFRTTPKPTSPAVDCYELNICDTHPQYGTGSLVERVVAENVPETDGQWNTFYVRMEGRQITVELNDQRILDFTDETENFLPLGHIGLQYREKKIEFKEIFLRPLGMTPLTQEGSLEGWHEVPGSQAEFQLQEGTTISVKGGEGYLETDKTYGDFILQAEAKTNAPSLNSGIFFRAQQGTEAAMANGYEVQIHNGMVNDDPQIPENWGTGSIFRRVPARHVNAQDQEWLTLTVIAYGPQFMTWVNGICVVSWRDQREPNENPREGLRLESGHLSLQAHDPTTDLNFRNLRIGNLKSAPKSE